ncbi:hypothetical protein J2S43_001408 [Catenuloplanes nepalensis]|uniref:SAM-dependent methyltransferase n=1 Tax=Catenuloplanes nepalensis TaxID=587533 RepID=A0ABT9MN83_9ACTN|nr:hypothetical protein [Catenuloplanes nepalensis]MDP9792896.1 hypothetical protein [Catenuloplanes nepalensis]
MSRRTADAVTWLRTDPDLDSLVGAYPAEWQRVRRELDAMIARDDAEELKAYITQVSRPEAATPGRARSQRDRLLAEVRRQMAIHLLKQQILSASTGVREGRVRFGLINGFIAQRLLFRRALERKPVPLGRFRLVWPLLTQRRRLMPLVRKRGIWCFYSKPLVRQLARLIDGRSCLEIAAGDGTLSRFLAAEGVDVVATDDHSWSGSIDFPEDVREEDARTALKRHSPKVVICSWPPAGNAFERFVFSTPSVELYIVIGSRHRESTGDWDAYERQTGFAMTTDARLSRLVLPPEIDHAVHLFRRHDHT